MTGIFGAARLAAGEWLAPERAHAQSTASSALPAPMTVNSVLVWSALPQ